MVTAAAASIVRSLTAALSTSEAEEEDGSQLVDAALV